MNSKLSKVGKKAISSKNLQNRLNINKKLGSNDLTKWLFKRYKIKTSSLDQVFNNKKLNKCLLKVDVEGFELDVLQGIDFDKYQPKFMLIEVRLRDRKAIDSFLKPLYEPIAVLSDSINQTLPERSYQDILYKATNIKSR